MAFEATRDLRSAAQDPKRAKTKLTKWSRGSRPAAGYKFHDNAFSGGESQSVKIRPERAFEHHRKPDHNIVKAKLGYDWPMTRTRAKVDAMEELADPAISRSLIDMLPATNVRRASIVADPFLYSFDKTETPGKPLSLDIFVKANKKETEKLVEKEYEIVDANGDTLTGRKARQNLRRPAQATASEPEIIEDEGFELI